MASFTKVVEASDVALVLLESAQAQRIIAYGFTAVGVILSAGMILFSQAKTFKTVTASVLITMGFFILCTLALMISAVDEVVWRADGVHTTSSTALIINARVQ